MSVAPNQKYRKPPVVEALCELVFEGSQWDDAVLGQFYDRVKDKFPKRRQMDIQQAQFVVSPQGQSAGIQRLPAQMQFLDAAESALLQLRQDLLVVNQLRPYPNFEGWEPNIYSALKVYWELTKPKGIRRIGLRYINRIIIPETSVRMEDYFNIYPQLPKEVGEVHGDFMIRVELPGQGEGHTVLVTFATAPPEQKGQTAHLLDFYDIFQPDSLLSEADVQAEARKARVNINTAFEGSITDKLRALFEPIK
jgi:uncharacterized protein (TIGR04255 family)